MMLTLAVATLPHCHAFSPSTLSHRSLSQTSFQDYSPRGCPEVCHGRGVNLRMTIGPIDSLNSDPGQDKERSRDPQSSGRATFLSDSSLGPSFSRRQAAAPIVGGFLLLMGQKKCAAFETRTDTLRQATISVSSLWKQSPGPERGITYSDPVAGQTLTLLDVITQPTKAISVKDLGRIESVDFVKVRPIT